MVVVALAQRHGFWGVTAASLGHKLQAEGHELKTEKHFRGGLKGPASSYL